MSSQGNDVAWQRFKTSLPSLEMSLADYLIFPPEDLQSEDVPPETLHLSTTDDPRTVVMNACGSASMLRGLILELERAKVKFSRTPTPEADEDWAQSNRLVDKIKFEVKDGVRLLTPEALKEADEHKKLAKTRRYSMRVTIPANRVNMQRLPRVVENLRRSAGFLERMGIDMLGDLGESVSLFDTQLGLNITPTKETAELALATFAEISPLLPVCMQKECAILPQYRFSIARGRAANTSYIGNVRANIQNDHLNDSDYYINRGGVAKLAILLGRIGHHINIPDLNEKISRQVQLLNESNDAVADAEIFASGIVAHHKIKAETKALLDMEAGLIHIDVIQGASDCGDDKRRAVELLCKRLDQFHIPYRVQALLETPGMFFIAIPATAATSAKLKMEKRDRETQASGEARPHRGRLTTPPTRS